MDYFQLDVEYIKKETLDCDFKNITILITGCAGFLCFYLINYFVHFKNQLKIKSIIGMDSFLLGYPNWLKKIKN